MINSFSKNKKKISKSKNQGTLLKNMRGMSGLEERLQIIHLSKNHSLPVSQISKEINKNESSIRKIIQEYEAKGRVNKLLTRSAKRLIL